MGTSLFSLRLHASARGRLSHHLTPERTRGTLVVAGAEAIPEVPGRAAGAPGDDLGRLVEEQRRIQTEVAGVSALVHKLPAEWHSRAVHVNVAGCGGNGCHVLMGLAQLQKALQGLGHPGLEVTAFDPDTVSEANLGRQLFTEEDVGQNKALTLIHRLNIAFGLDWGAIPLDHRPYQRTPDLLISCVDSEQARALIHDRIWAVQAHYRRGLV